MGVRAGAALACRCLGGGVFWVGELQMQMSWGRIMLGVPEEQGGDPGLAWSRVERLWEAGSWTAGQTPQQGSLDLLQLRVSF